MSNRKMLFEGECRHCDHTIKAEIEPHDELINNHDEPARIKCKECRGITAIEQTGIA